MLNDFMKFTEDMRKKVASSFQRHLDEANAAKEAAAGATGEAGATLLNAAPPKPAVLNERVEQPETTGGLSLPKSRPFGGVPLPGLTNRPALPEAAGAAT